MNIEKRIRQIAAKKVKVIITAKVRNREGFRVMIEDDFLNTRTELGESQNRKQALQLLLAKLRVAPVITFKIEPVKHTPNPKHKADVPWKRKLL